MPANFPGSHLPRPPGKQAERLIALETNKPENMYNSLNNLVQSVKDQSKEPVSKDQLLWLKKLESCSRVELLTGSQVYGKFYRHDQSDADILIKVNKKDFAKKLLFLEKDPGKYYARGTIRYRIGGIDFILTTSSKVFNQWAEITNFLKNNPPPNKSEVVKMFDMMREGSDYQAYYFNKFGWSADYLENLGKMARVKKDAQKIVGVYNQNNCTYYVLENAPSDFFPPYRSGYDIYSSDTYFGDELDRSKTYAIVSPSNIFSIFEADLATDNNKMMDESMMDESMMDESMNAPEKSYKDALKSSGNKMKGHIKHGMAVGAATEGASYAYQQVANVLRTQFGVSEESLNDPIKRELITFAALAVTHMGATVFDEVPGMDKVTKGCELAIEGKAKDNTGALIQHVLPMLLNVSKAMDPEAQMQRIMADAERQRVEALDIDVDVDVDEEAHAEVVALEQKNGRKAKQS